MLRAVASCANEVVDALGLPARHGAPALQRVAQRYGRALDIDPARPAAGAPQGSRRAATPTTTLAAAPEPHAAARERLPRHARAAGVSAADAQRRSAAAGAASGASSCCDVLGRGAQATVWLAHDPRLDREVALKLLDAGRRHMPVHQWLHEARAVSRLTHPNIVPVFEADEHDGQPYLVFEYVRRPDAGRSAAAQRRACRRARRWTLMLGVLDALHAAHAQGIVHRDLKPSNILVGADGRARVMDFGIAARVPADSAADGQRSSARPATCRPRRRAARRRRRRWTCLRPA